jgi:hypothetical protein
MLFEALDNVYIIISAQFLGQYQVTTDGDTFWLTKRPFLLQVQGVGLTSEIGLLFH